MYRNTPGLTAGPYEGEGGFSVPRHHRLCGIFNSDGYRMRRWKDIPVTECQSLGILGLPPLLGPGYPQAERHARPRGEADPQVNMQARETPLKQVPPVVSPCGLRAPFPSHFLPEQESLHFLVSVGQARGSKGGTTLFSGKFYTQWRVTSGCIRSPSHPQVPFPQSA